MNKSLKKCQTIQVITRFKIISPTFSLPFVSRAILSVWWHSVALDPIFARVLKCSRNVCGTPWKKEQVDSLKFLSRVFSHCI